jgi:hypothetical protein
MKFKWEEILHSLFHIIKARGDRVSERAKQKEKRHKKWLYNQ